jgi:hypothetical protein
MNRAALVGIVVLAACCLVCADTDPNIILRPDPTPVTPIGAAGLTFELSQSGVCSTSDDNNFICDFTNSSGANWGALALKVTPNEDILGTLNCSSQFTGSDPQFKNCIDLGDFNSSHLFVFNLGTIAGGSGFALEFDGFAEDINTEVQLKPTLLPEPGTILLLISGLGVTALQRRGSSVLGYFGRKVSNLW